METKIERNYGIDLLRIISMFFIIILHILGQGGVLSHTVTNTIQFKVGWFLEISAYAAVNIFALISGYVSYTDEEKKYKFSNYIKIWFEVVFYGLVMCLIFNYINPSLVTKKDFVMSILPVTNKLYWYFTAYTGLYLLMPFINRAIRNSSEMSLKKLFIVIFLVFSLFDCFANAFVLNSGYALIWIILLYVMGAIIKKCNIGKNLKWYHIIPGILLLTIAALLYRLYGYEGKILNVTISKRLFVTYTAPTILGIAIFYLIGFSKLKLSNIMIKITKFMAPAAFSIYLINNQTFFWTEVMKDRFAFLGTAPIFELCYKVIGSAILFVIACIIIDNVRIQLFKLFRLNNLAEIFSLGLYTILEFFSKKFLRG